MGFLLQLALVHLIFTLRQSSEDHSKKPTPRGHLQTNDVTQTLFFILKNTVTIIRVWSYYYHIGVADGHGSDRDAGAPAQTAWSGARD